MSRQEQSSVTANETGKDNYRLCNSMWKQTKLDTKYFWEEEKNTTLTPGSNQTITPIIDF